MKTNDRFNFLLSQYLAGDIDINQKDELFQFIESETHDEILSYEIEQDLYAEEALNTAGLPPYISEEIIRKIFKSEQGVNQIIAKKRSSKWVTSKWAIAALFMGVVCLSYFSFSLLKNTNSNFTSIIPQNIGSQVNDSKSVQLLSLNDGTKVYLEPGSRLYYHKQFKGDYREVYLEGEAFFQVKKNPRKPFLVYYNNIVTKVLGTSFHIGTNKNDGQFVVEVSTGRVQVSENAKLTVSTKTISPVIITPNQKVSYDKSIRRFETSIVENPIAVAPSDGELSPELHLLFQDQQKLTNSTELMPISHSLFFEQQKLNIIFSKLEKLYQIDISVENAAMYNCVFTGDISNLDLFSALKTICIATNSRYEVNGTKILIIGKGCN